MNNSYENLLESIRAKCQQEHWFGPKLLSPARCESVSATDPNRFGFVFPAASEEQLQLTESLLGFPLPPLLRALYVEIANGGFGPGTGLRGVLDGYGKPGTMYPNEDETIIGTYQFESRKGTTTLVEQAMQEEEQSLVCLQIPYGIWPAQVLPICHLGCVQEACIDSRQRMFIAAPINSNEVYGFYQLPWTFEEWLWRWIKNEHLVE